MTIYKRVPVRAGMAGGSADAAGVLVGLNDLYDARLSMSELCASAQASGRTCPLLCWAAPAGCGAWAT